MTRDASNTQAVNERNTKPSQFQIFKGKSAMRLQLDKPERADQVYQIGCLYLQAAPAKPGATGENRSFDWEDKKISAKLGINDITKLVHGLANGENVDLFHEFNGDTKSIKFQINNEKGGYFLNLEQKSQRNGDQKIMVPISSEETTVLVIMLRAVLPLIHNWS